MLIKTIKLNPGEYTNFDNEFDEHDVIMLNGARGSGKSYPSAKYISRMLLNDVNSKYIYMRNTKDELPTYRGWASDMDCELIAGSPEYELVRGTPTAGDITITGNDEESGREISRRHIGKCVSLEKSKNFKSDKYDEYKAIIFEEYTFSGMSPNNEKTYVFNFIENVISIFRDRPKKIFLISNNFKNVPLLESAIENYTGKIFKSPIKIKIFRRMNENEKQDEFMAYLNGEVYNADDFIVNISEFFPLYFNRMFTIKQHKIFSRKFYITGNKAGDKHTYNTEEFLRLKNFLLLGSNAEFYYQNISIEKEFTVEFPKLCREISKFISDYGTRYIM